MTSFRIPTTIYVIDCIPLSKGKSSIARQREAAQQKRLRQGPEEIQREDRRETAQIHDRDLADRTVTLGELPADNFNDAVLVADFPAETGASGRIVHLAMRWKRHNLPDPGLNVEADNTGVGRHVSATPPAFFVMLGSAAPGRFFDNVLDLLPGATGRIGFAPDKAIPFSPGADDFVWRDLFSSRQRSA